MNNEIRIMKNVDELIVNPANLKSHNERSINEIMEALSTYGQQEPIVIASNNIVLAGNGRLIAARKLKWTEIWVTTSELEGSKAIAYSISDNKVAESSEWIYSDLGKTMSQIIDSNPKITLTSMGFEEFEYQPLLNYSASVKLPMNNLLEEENNFQTIFNGTSERESNKSSKSKNTNNDLDSNTPSLSVNSFENNNKKNKSNKSKKEDLNFLDSKNNSTTILVTQDQNKTIERLVLKVREEKKDPTLTTGEILEFICLEYLQDNSELSDIEDMNELEGF